MATQMRRRRFAGVAGWVAAVVAVPVLVMVLAAGSLRGQEQPIYEHGAYDPVRFGTSFAEVQLLRVALHEGAQVWVYEVTSGGAPTPIDFWQLGVCPDITQADILGLTEDFELKPLSIDPNYHTIEFPLKYEPTEDRTVAFALADRWPIVRQPARVELEV